MKSPIGWACAVLMTTSLVFAGGEGEGKKGGEKTPAPKKETENPFVDGWSAEAGKGLSYTSDTFAINIRNGAQILFAYGDVEARLNNGATPTLVPGDDVTGFELPRVRTDMTGFIYESRIRYRVNLEWNDADNPIKDVWIDYSFYDTDAYDMAFRFGQGKTRFGREFNADEFALDFINRGLATRTFTNSRSRMAMLHGSAHDHLGWSVTLSQNDMAAAAENSGEEGDPRLLPNANDDQDNELNWTFEAHYTSNPDAIRYEEGAMGDLTGQAGWGAGLAYYLGMARHATGTAITDANVYSLNAWAEWKSGNGIDVLGEFFHRKEDSDNPAVTGDSQASGYQLQASYTFPKVEGQHQWGFGVRYSAVNNDDSMLLLTQGLLQGLEYDGSELEATINVHYHGHDAKTQLGLLWQNLDDPNNVNPTADNYVLAIQNTFRF